MWCGCPAWATGTELKQKIILILVQFGLPSKLFSHKSQNRSGYILIRVKPAPNNQPDRVAIKEKIHLNLIIPSHTHTHTHKTSQFQPLPNPSLLLLPLPNPSPSSVDLILTHSSPILPSSGEPWRPTLPPPRWRRLRPRDVSSQLMGFSSSKAAMKIREDAKDSFFLIYMKLKLILNRKFSIFF